MYAWATEVKLHSNLLRYDQHSLEIVIKATTEVT